ncbi:hypothetical protein [Vibrio spartinae]|uniref:Uncharacterized protein n=1 Tax=Vibrio spartinae TaxID=1918945 RepID=A0A1N6M2J4_9VIBR|nr:hypothetical protein [Vibrio spartinae]SIO93658.1 hypothetical protein VSP9026_01328 [Vibrio spartinae]
MFINKDVIKLLESKVQNLLDKEFEKDSVMSDFHQTDWFNKEYYKRHILECVIRINMNNELDARAVAVACKGNIPAAKKLSYYLYDELGHDEMFAQDLTKYGYSISDIKDENAFPSTLKLMGYLTYSVERFGPLSAIIWDWFLEYYGDNYNPFITQKAGTYLGGEEVSGAASHVAFDEAEDHSGMMTEMLSTVIKSEHDLKNAIQYIETFIPMIGEYFSELKENTL